MTHAQADEHLKDTDPSLTQTWLQVDEHLKDTDPSLTWLSSNLQKPSSPNFSF